MQHANNDDDPNAPFPGFQQQQQWGNYDQPQYPPQQNGLQIIVNLPPNGFQQQPQANVAGSIHFNQFPQDDNQYPYQQPNINSFAPYQGSNNDDLPAPIQNDDDQPSQHNQYSGGQEYAKPNPPVANLFKSSFSCNISESKIKRFLGLLLLFFTVANLAIIIALLVYHFGNKDVTLTSVAGALEYMGENLSADPILELRVKDDTGSCDSGYHSMLLGTWPGTVAGCDCPITGLKKGTCNKSGKHPTDLLCTDIYPRSSIDMVDWGGSYWCVKKAKLGTQYTRSVTCDTGFRECSPGICVLSSLNCPVTKVEVQSSGTYKMRVGTNKYVVTTSTQGDDPVVDLIITPNDIPCFSNDYYAAGSTTPYKLINENEKGCSKYGSDNKNSFKIDKMTQDTLFDQNDFPSKVMNLPDYDDTYENTYSVLSYRQRISVAENDFCLSIDTDLLEKSSYAAEKLNKFMSGTSIAAIIIHGILVLIVGIFIGIMKSSGKSWGEILKGKGETMIWTCFCAGIGFIEYIDLIVMFAAAKHYRGIMVTTEQYLGELASTNCFLDSQPQEAVSDYQVAVDVVAGTLYKYAITLFLITTFTVLPSFYMIWKNLKS